MKSSTPLIALLALSLAAASSAQGTSKPFIGANEDPRPPKQLPPGFQKKPGKNQPLILRMMLHEVPNGMLVALPIIDTNPNKGTTMGVMPIYVVLPSHKNIAHIFAPSLTYNPTFRIEATMRYYWYPNERANYFVRAAVSGNQNQDFIGQMEDLDFLGRGLALSARLAFDVDGSKRFFGVGPEFVTVTGLELTELTRVLNSLDRTMREEPRTVTIHNNNVKNTHPSRKAQEAEIRNGQNDLQRRAG
ncbi:MAG: hypothetical protein IIC01_11610 [Planctomycetes bacterium]|nr:hypothetical protein [Planctomycetota bacterium]